MNNKKHNSYLIFGVTAAFLIYVAVLVLSPKPIDWGLSFSKKDKIPFGNSILFSELGQLFPESEISTSHSAIYNYFDDSIVSKVNVIYITNEFKPNRLDVDRLLSVVNKGSNVFIAAVEFVNLLEDTLGFKLKEEIDFNLLKKDSTTLSLVNTKLKSAWGYTYKKAYHKSYFTKYDTLKTTVLGLGDKAKTNFIKVKYGLGTFFLNTNPLAFTNYNLLVDKNYEYVFKSLSYLPNSAVVWDEHYKVKAVVSSSVFRYILSQKGLRYAWYILLFGLVTYMVFGAKRRQRMIPIVNPPQNTTLTFIETIGRLYFRRRNHLDIAKKKYTYFLEFLRTKYYVNTSGFNEELFHEIAEKCDVPLRSVKQLFEIAQKLEHINSISEEDLEQFNKKIEFFYDKCKATNNKRYGESNLV